MLRVGYQSYSQNYLQLSMQLYSLKFQSRDFFSSYSGVHFVPVHTLAIVQTITNAECVLLLLLLLGKGKSSDTVTQSTLSAPVNV